MLNVSHALLGALAVMAMTVRFRPVTAERRAESALWDSGVPLANTALKTLDLFENPVGSRTSPAKCSAFCCFSAEVVGKMKFPNNSIIQANVDEVVGFVESYHGPLLL
jgi:hypothetical protein